MDVAWTLLWEYNINKIHILQWRWEYRTTVFGVAPSRAFARSSVAVWIRWLLFRHITGSHRKQESWSVHCKGIVRGPNTCPEASEAIHTGRLAVSCYSLINNNSFKLPGTRVVRSTAHQTLCYTETISAPPTAVSLLLCHVVHSRERASVRSRSLQRDAGERCAQGGRP